MRVTRSRIAPSSRASGLSPAWGPRGSAGPRRFRVVFAAVVFLAAVFLAGIAVTLPARVDLRALARARRRLLDLGREEARVGADAREHRVDVDGHTASREVPGERHDIASEEI